MDGGGRGDEGRADGGGRGDEGRADGGGRRDEGRADGGDVRTDGGRIGRGDEGTDSGARTAAAAGVRVAVPADAGRLGAVQLACRRETYAGLLSPGLLAGLRVGELVARWRWVLDELPGSTAIAEVGGEAAGFASTRPGEAGSPRDLDLWGIYVLAAHQGTGLGQALLDAVLGDRPAFLWVAEQNLRAQTFYRRNGFVPDGGRQVLEGWESLVVVRMVR